MKPRIFEVNNIAESLFNFFVTRSELEFVG